jgi:flagellar basal body-associated protein FliL
MHEKSWLEISKKRNKGYIYVIVILAIAGAAIFLHNNRELFFSKSSEPKKSLETEAASGKKPLETDSIAGKKTPEAAATQETQNPPVEKAKEVQQTPGPVPVVFSVEIPDIQCGLRGSREFKVRVSLKLFLAGDANKNEVLEKRENLKVMAQKVFSTKTIDELIVDSLRLETKAAMNRILEKGAISDVEFKDFRIDKVKK